MLRSIQATGRLISIVSAGCRKEGRVNDKEKKTSGRRTEEADCKKAEVEARITETQDQIQEETNIEIHEMVHAAHLTPEQLADVLAAFRKGSIPVNAMDMITEEETDHD